MTLEEKKTSLVEEITLIPDPYERLGYIVDHGKKAEGLPEDFRIDSFKIEGCMSKRWVVTSFKTIDGSQNVGIGTRFPDSSLEGKHGPTA